MQKKKVALNNLRMLCIALKVFDVRGAEFHSDGSNNSNISSWF